MTAQKQVQAPKIHRGLAGVYIDRSQVSMIDGKNGVLSYRGYSIEDLVENTSFDETSFLLVNGWLPSQPELERFKKDLVSARTLPEGIIDLISSMRSSHPMDVLRSTVSALAASDPDREDESAEAIKRKTVRLIAQSATAVATHLAFRQGRNAPVSNRHLNHAASFLSMLRGEAPDPDLGLLFDQDMIVHAEHGSNASAFTARVVASAGADFHASITAAIGCFAGASHGGAVEGVMQMVREIGDPERTKTYIADRHRRRDPVMGFGHRVYRTADPRAKYLRGHAETLSRMQGNETWLEILDRVAEEMKPYMRHGVNVNVDFYAAVSYALLGIPDDFFGAVFAVSRMPGWAAQILEQKENNILIRPLLLYVGEQDRSFLPVEER
ncbi:citrate/2-methylcitrate synthase [Pelagibius sp.]|uniref:citrate/2-methylcitrate synthase n=1 Tax=Pelagibius sp. TaxID=1931238 RepID=UPI003B50BECD